MKCSPGYYCISSASSKTPIGLDSGDRCSAGYYCPEGSGKPIPCPPGLACPNSGMSLEDGGGSNVASTHAMANPCDAGFYCQYGAVKTAPTAIEDGGQICPAGYYCPATGHADNEDETDYLSGTRHPYPCVPGTYRSSTGGETSADCTSCPAGYYCPDYATTQYTVCDEGWYCETDATASGLPAETGPRPDGKFCPVGHYCTQGNKFECEAGKYQDLVGQSSCVTCPAGYQCPYQNVNLRANSKEVCGQNYYCESGTNVRTRCPNNMYTEKLTSS